MDKTHSRNNVIYPDLNAYNSNEFTYFSIATLNLFTISPCSSKSSSLHTRRLNLELNYKELSQFEFFRFPFFLFSIANIIASV